MKVELVGLSQGISFEKKQATNYLDFRKDSGELFRLEVSSDVSEALLAIMLKEDATPEPPPPQPEVAHEEDESGTTFGGDVLPEEEVDGPNRPPALDSEDEVPTL